MSRLPPAPDLDWSETGAPVSRAFGDVYFSAAGGLAEAGAVFLAGCGLPEAWAGRDRFAILELGFGAGVNALATQRAWARTRAPGAVLHYVTIEAFPMARADAARALAAFPELAESAGRLLESWPVRAYAPQRFWFDDFALTFLCGDAQEILRTLDGRFDAFFLDGFAPSRNPQMWGEETARLLAAHAAPGARCATYSVAGAVRRALESAGFVVEKKPGFAGKRERLVGRIATPPSPAHSLYPSGGAAPRRVAIVGGGIAGAAAAHALSRRGARVTLLERGAALGAGASGNAAGLVMPRLNRGRGPVQEVFLAAFLHAARAYQACGALAACGVVERAREDLIADPPLPADWLTPNGQPQCVLHTHAGVVQPHIALAAWTRDVGVRFGVEVAKLERAGDVWRLLSADGALLCEAEAVVLANGPFLTGFAQTDWLELRRTAGQIEQAALGGEGPAHALVEESYVAPLGAQLIFGASFERTTADAAYISDDARVANLDALAKLAPELAERIDQSMPRSRAALRVAAPDYVPVMGLAPDAPAWLARQAGLAHGRPADLSAPAPRHEGLYLLGGLSARGLTLAPLLAEALASDMFGEPGPLSSANLAAIHPARFLHRVVRRGLTKPAARAEHSEQQRIPGRRLHGDEP